MEQLDLAIAGTAIPDTIAQHILQSMSATNTHTMKVPCPNMVVLRLQFFDIPVANREWISDSCRQMMDKRRLAGCFMEKCYIWWHHEDWETDAPFVLVMENEVVRVSS